MGSLFGSSGNTKQVNQLTGDQSNLFTQLGSLLGSNVGTGVSSYPGTYTAPASSLQTQLWDSLSGSMSQDYMGTLLGNASLAASQALTGQSNLDQMLSGATSTSPAASWINSVFGDIGGATSDLYSSLIGSLPTETATALRTQMQPWDQSQATDWWNKSVKAPTMATYNQTTVPTTMEKFAGYDAASSGGAAKAVSESGSNLATSLASSLSNYLSTDKQNAAQNLLTAAGKSTDLTKTIGSLSSGLESTAGSLYNSLLSTVGGLYNTELGTAGSLAGSLWSKLTDAASAAGSTQRDVTQAGLTEQYKDWQTEQSYNNPWLSYMSDYLNQSTFSNTTTGSDSGIMGGLMSVLNLFKGIDNTFGTGIGASALGKGSANSSTSTGSSGSSGISSGAARSYLAENEGSLASLLAFM